MATPTDTRYMARLLLELLGAPRPWPTLGLGGTGPALKPGTLAAGSPPADAGVLGLGPCAGTSEVPDPALEDNVRKHGKRGPAGNDVFEIARRETGAGHAGKCRERKLAEATRENAGGDNAGQECEAKRSDGQRKCMERRWQDTGEERVGGEQNC